MILLHNSKNFPFYLPNYLTYKTDFEKSCKVPRACLAADDCLMDWGNSEYEKRISNPHTPVNWCQNCI